MSTVLDNKETGLETRSDKQSCFKESGILFHNPPVVSIEMNYFLFLDQVESKDLDKRLKKSTKLRYDKISILCLLIVFCFIPSAYILHDFYHVYNNNCVFDQQEKVPILHTVERNGNSIRPVDKINIIAESKYSIFIVNISNTVNDDCSWNWCEGCHLRGYFPYNTTTIKHDVTYELTIDFTTYSISISISPGKTVNDCNKRVLVYSFGYCLNHIKTITKDDPQDLLHKATKLIDFTRYTLSPITIFISKSRVEHFEVYNTDTRISISPDINECKLNPCKHGASCMNEVNGPACVCKPGYNGKNCEIGINECKTNPCKHGASCMDKVNDYICVCKPGYNGKNCEIDINNCQSKPCQHGGKCEDQINGYRCTCIPGYTGSNCEIGAFCVNRPFYLRRLYVTSCFTGTYDNMMSLGRILVAIGGFILLHTHLSGVNDVSNFREKTTVIQVNTFPFAGLILLMLYLKLGTFFTFVGKNSFAENKLTGMIQNIKKGDAVLLKGFTTKHFGRIHHINLQIHKFVSNRSAMIPKLGMIVPKTNLDQMKTSSGREHQGRYFSRREWIKCQMCIDRNEALYWCNTCKRSICSFCKLYHEKVWIVKDHDVEALRLLF